MPIRPLPFSAGPSFALVFWGAFAIWILPEINAWRVKRSTDFSQKLDQGSLNFIALLWWIGLAASFLFSMLLPRAAILWERAGLFYSGICLMLLGVALRWYSAAILGKYFTFDVSIQSGQMLVESGPYRYIRHPSYSGALLTLLGFGLALGNWASLVVAPSCLGIAYARRIPVEESALVRTLGETYEQYMKRTWRLVPFLF